MRATFLLLCTLLCLQSDANDDLQRYLPPDQLHWLSDDGDNRYLALHKEAMTSFPRGQIVSIPDWHLHPLQSRLVSYSYNHSPDIGWHSWALVPPALTIERHQLGQSQPDSNYPSPVEASFFDAHINGLQQRLLRINDEFSQQPGFNLWLVEGITAALAIKLILQQPDMMPDALIIIDMYLPQKQLNQRVSDQLAQLQLPVLEVVSNNANRWVRQTQDLRRQLSQKYQQVNYRQRALISHGGLADQEYFSTLRGWLKYHGF